MRRMHVGVCLRGPAMLVGRIVACPFDEESEAEYRRLLSVTSRQA